MKGAIEVYGGRKAKGYGIKDLKIASDVAIAAFIRVESYGGKVRLRIGVGDDSQRIDLYLSPEEVADLVSDLQSEANDAKLELHTARERGLEREPSELEVVAFNSLSGKPFIKSIDAPYGTTPDSEAYWSN